MILENNQIQDSSLPSGLICMWSGSNIPEGWVLCNGQNNTPDLRDRFIVGSGSSYSIGDTGGSSAVTLTTAQMPSHNHSGTMSMSNITLKVSTIGKYGATEHAHGADYGKTEISSGVSVASNNWINNTSNVSGSLSGTATIASAGSGSAHENRPPYYALAFIMKL